MAYHFDSHARHVSQQEAEKDKGHHFGQPFFAFSQSTWHLDRRSLHLSFQRPTHHLHLEESSSCICISGCASADLGEDHEVGDEQDATGNEEATHEEKVFGRSVVVILQDRARSVWK